MIPMIYDLGAAIDRLSLQKLIFQAMGSYIITIGLSNEQQGMSFKLN